MNAAAWGGVAFLLVAACGPARAAESLGAATPRPRPGWQRMSKSLLCYDAEGNLSNEIGLGRWEDASLSQIKIKVIDGGTSPDGRFAWALDKRTTWNSLKTKVLESQHILRFFAPDGKELWSEDGADSLPGSAPLVFSDDGKTCLLALRRSSGWYALVKTYLGNTLWEVGPFPKLDALQISPNGRYGMARWNDPDKTASHSFLDLRDKVRQDVASDRFLLGKTAVDDEGRAFSGSKPVFSFSGPAASTASASGQGRPTP